MWSYHAGVTHADGLAHTMSGRLPTLPLGRPYTVDDVQGSLPATLSHSYFTWLIGMGALRILPCPGTRPAADMRSNRLRWYQKSDDIGEGHRYTHHQGKAVTVRTEAISFECDSSFCEQPTPVSCLTCRLDTRQPREQSLDGIRPANSYLLGKTRARSIPRATYRTWVI